MTAIDSTVEDIAAQAAEWHVASSGDAMDWDGFTLWLEADPRHRLCYDEVALADALLGDHAGDLAAPVETAPVRSRRWPWLATGMMVAASLALVLFVPGWRAPAQNVTVSGDTAHQIALGDGSRITLAPHSRLTVTGDRLALDGEARFAIRHDPARTMQVTAGALTIEDIGTTFDVAASGTAVRIAVSEGNVAVVGTAAANAVHLGQGDGLIYGKSFGTRQVPGQGLGLAGWTSGALSYVDAPLPVVAEDIARLTGVPITVAPALGARRFSGSLTLAQGADAAQDLATLMDLRLTHKGHMVTLDAARR